MDALHTIKKKLSSTEKLTSAGTEKADADGIWVTREVDRGLAQRSPLGYFPPLGCLCIVA